MSVTAATWLLAALGGYGAIGAVVGILFLAGPIERADPAARGAHAFRPLLLPGLVLLWPLVLWRWPRGALSRRSGRG